ncbi:hypothetical protein EOM82_08135 [bacterium]|nr:hypothetical protein [bacterium]
MINIIRNCSHNGDVCTGIKTDDNGLPVLIVRTTFSAKGVMALSRELQGISKYSERLNTGREKNIINFKLLDSYGKMELKYHNGMPGDYMAQLDKNYQKISELISYYRRVFCDNKELISHGDFSISNVLFEGSSVKWIMDWENANDIMPREYDLIYCITENVLCSLAKRGFLSKAEISVYHSLFFKIEKEVGAACGIKKAPGRWCLDMALDYVRKTGVDYQRCPFIAYSHDPDAKCIIDKLDALLKS